MTEDKFVLTKEQLLDFIEASIKVRAYEKLTNYNTVLPDYLIDEWINSCRDEALNQLGNYEKLQGN